LKTVCPTNLTVDAVCAALEGATEVTQMTFGRTGVFYATVPLPAELLGKTIAEVVPEQGAMLFGIQKSDNRMVLAINKNEGLEAGDELVFAKLAD
ncbi:MAG: TrkA C-terminal domain-containing protein, partial [Hydrogenoanaerobacterium sp.]